MILKDISTRAPQDIDKAECKEITKQLIDELGELQYLMNAESKHSLLLVFQGMDASGKDGVVRDVFSMVNPSGIRVQSFKKPTDEEFAHDFLWRVHKHVPQDGMIQIFNRSHYEDVLIQRVHNWIDEEKVHKRFNHINNFEQLVQDNGTTILKFYLHVSKEEQLVRLNERKEILRKNWKHNDNDFKEREHWDSYMLAYEDCFKHCSPDIPWTIVPAEQNWYKRYVVAKKVVETLRGFNMQFPKIEAQ